MHYPNYTPSACDERQFLRQIFWYRFRRRIKRVGITLVMLALITACAVGGWVLFTT
jgi:hypothetical protein